MFEPHEDIKVISWDMDGTLYSSSDFKRRLYAGWLKQCWRPSVWRDMQVIDRSQKMLQRVRDAGGEGPEFMPALRARAEQREIPWFRDALAASGLREGVQDFLEAFKERGYPQIIISDYHADYKLKALGIARYFDESFACEDFGRFKPSPSVFEEACRKLDIQPQSLLHIGDREDTDGMAARKAGCKVEIVSASGVFCLS